MIVKDVLLYASNQVAHANQLNQHTAKLEAQLLLQHVLQVDRAWLIAHEYDELPTNHYLLFEPLLNRRLNGESTAYILGNREFFGLKLKVSADTLIPRPDTETLVEAALAKVPPSATSPLSSFPQKRDSRLRGNDEVNAENVPKVSALAQKIRVLDLGTGSGAIALAIAKHRPNVKLTAVDASQAALNIAIENAQALDITNVEFVLSNWFGTLNNQQFDVIVSNPPYIEDDDIHLSQGDLRFEPLSALASGKDGLDDIRRITHSAPNYLKPNGWLMFEHGYNQAQNVAEMMAENGFSQISHIKDLAGILRVTMGQLSKL